MVTESQKAINKAIDKAIESLKEKIWEINKKIFENPETSSKEFKAHDSICKFFKSQNKGPSKPGYTISRSKWSPTSFLIEVSTYKATGDPKQSSTPRTVIYNAEYDALPGMRNKTNTIAEPYPAIESNNPTTSGAAVRSDLESNNAAHACGHNLIASASIAAFIGCCKALRERGVKGTVRLYGTPAEESGGSKIKLLKAGAYKGVNAYLIAHPGPLTSDRDLRAIAFTKSLASRRLTVKFKGAASHVRLGNPAERNALNAVINSYNSISELRRELTEFQMVSGIITNRGETANIIPGNTAAQYSIKAESVRDLHNLNDRVCERLNLEGQAAGCKTKITR
ncbi:hypothetical protein IL306_013256 [Fusarium sp. DS 682]|nr:hypothetical protein IL306_013256 [Fusarium sp. DS 682]